MNLLSGYPYWLIKSGLLYQYPALEKSIKKEVVIIGGGISGALMAYHLMQAGIDCMVIDGRSIGLGSTCASTSLLQYEIDIPLSKLKDKIGETNAIRSYKLCELAIHKLYTICKKIHAEDFAYKKSLYYAAEKKDLQSLQEESTYRKNNGFAVTYLDENTIKNMFGFTAPGAILSDVAAETDAYKLTHALLQYCKRKGVEIYDRSPVINMQHNEHSVTMQTEAGYSIVADKLIYATGYEAVKYIDKKIVTLQSTYATISEPLHSSVNFWQDGTLLWNTASPYLYMRTTNDRRIIIGGRDEKFSSRSDSQIEKKTKQLENDFTSIFPYQKFTREFNWTGVFGTTKDGLPYIGPYKQLPNSYFALGFGGNGITFSLIAAEIITNMIKGIRNNDADMFSFER